MSSKTCVVFLPGLLARAAEQSAPILDALNTLGAVELIDYPKKGWRPGLIAAAAARKVRSLLMDYDNVVIFGVSLGGILAAMVVDQLSDEECDRIKVVAVDSPCGPETLVPLPAVARPFFTSGAYKVFNGALGNFFRERRMSVPPKPGNIEVPIGTLDDDVYKRVVIETAKQGLSGHTWSAWGGQTAWMAAGIPDLSPLNRVHEVTYLACVGLKNDTVAQPLALERWKKQVPGLFVRWVSTAHAAFLEAWPTFDKFVRSLA